MRFLFHRGRAFHATVVVGDVEENEFGDVDESSPVVFLDSSEGQVDEVEKDETKRRACDEKSSFFVVDFAGNVAAKDDSIDQGQYDVNFANPAFFKPLFELSIPFLAAEEKPTDNSSEQQST